MKLPLASLNLPTKLALALVSAGSYGLVTLLSALSEALDAVLSKANSGLHLIALVFGLLVMVPYVVPTGRWALRAAAMCIASAAIYYAAVRFVADGPLGYDTITSFVLSGAGAALLAGLAVVVLGPRQFTAKLIPLMLVAGAAGGVVFEHKVSIDDTMLLGHLVWQLLVCLALHFSFRATRHNQAARPRSTNNRFRQGDQQCVERSSCGVVTKALSPRARSVTTSISVIGRAQTRPPRI